MKIRPLDKQFFLSSTYQLCKVNCFTIILEYSLQKKVIYLIRDNCLFFLVSSVRTVDERDHQIDDHQQQQMTERRLSFLKVPVNLSHRQRSIDSTSTVYMNNPHYVSRPNIENSVDSASTVYMDNHCVPKIRVNSANSVNSSTLYVENRVPMTFNGLEAISSTKIFHPVRYLWSKID